MTSQSSLGSVWIMTKLGMHFWQVDAKVEPERLGSLPQASRVPGPNPTIQSLPPEASYLH